MDNLLAKETTVNLDKPPPLQKHSKKINKHKKAQLEQSLSEYKEAKETFVKLFGTNDEKTIAVNDIIAAQLFQLERYDEALALYVELHDNYEKSYGKCDATTLKVNEKIVLTYLKMNQSEVFLDMLKSLCAVYKDELHYEECDVAQIKLMFVRYLEQEENFTTAEIVLQDLLNTYLNVYGGKDLRSLKIKITMAELMIKKKEYDEALGLLSKTTEELEETQGAITSEALHAQRLTANIYMNIGELDIALEMFLELFAKYMECYNGECMETLTIRGSLAAVLLKQQNYEQALSIYSAVYESYLNIPETSLAVLAHIKHIIGHIHLKENRLYEAETIFSEVLEKYNNIHEDNETHLDVLEATASMGALKLKEKKFEESRHHYLHVLGCYKEIFGESHPKTIQVEDILMDLNELDSMLTSEDRVKIEENVKVNEANNYGSHDLEKYALPKISMLEKKRTESVYTTQSKASSNITTETEGDDTSTYRGSTTMEIGGRTILPITPMKRPKAIDENSLQPEDTLNPNSEIESKTNSKVDMNGNRISDIEFDDEISTTTNDIKIKVSDLETETNLGKEAGPSNRPLDENKSLHAPSAWDDVNLNSTRDSDRSDIMKGIQKQLAQKKKKKKCKCCTIS